MTAPLYEIPVQEITGHETSLAEYKGSVLLIVNVASKCGLTPQYAGLEQLYETYHDKGFSVLGFPANDFGAQEPGTNDEILEFCTTKFDVKFPMFGKVATKGEDQHPLYRYLTEVQPKAAMKPDGDLLGKLQKYGMAPKTETEIMWNFEKFLVDRNGEIVGRFAPDVTPDDPMVTGAIETELAKA